MITHILPQRHGKHREKQKETLKLCVLRVVSSQKSGAFVGRPTFPRTIESSLERRYRHVGNHQGVGRKRQIAS